MALLLKVGIPVSVPHNEGAHSRRRSRDRWNCFANDTNKRRLIVSIWSREDWSRDTRFTVDTMRLCDSLRIWRRGVVNWVRVWTRGPDVVLSGIPNYLLTYVDSILLVMKYTPSSK